MGAIEVLNAYFRYETSYVKALDRGWRVMPSANSDTHRAGLDLRPSSADRAPCARSSRRLRSSKRCGRARGYATAISDLRVTFRGNGEVMGSTLSQPRRIAFTVRVSDPKPRARATRYAA